MAPAESACPGIYLSPALLLAGNDAGLARPLGGPHLLAVNSFDDTLRVYDRGFGPCSALDKLHAVPVAGACGAEVGTGVAPGMGRGARTVTDAGEGPGQVLGPGAGRGSGSGPGADAVGGSNRAGDETAEEPSVAALHALVGHKNRAYPIRSAIHVGAEYGRCREQSVQSTVLLATGSSDGDAFLFDIGGSFGTGELVQRLRGHSDRVYSVDFHPIKPLLATASADFTVKLWSAGRTRQHGRNGQAERLQLV